MLTVDDNHPIPPHLLISGRENMRRSVSRAVTMPLVETPSRSSLALFQDASIGDDASLLREVGSSSSSSIVCIPDSDSALHTPSKMRSSMIQSSFHLSAEPPTRTVAKSGLSRSDFPFPARTALSQPRTLNMSILHSDISSYSTAAADASPAHSFSSPSDSGGMSSHPPALLVTPTKHSLPASPSTPELPSSLQNSPCAPHPMGHQSTDLCPLSFPALDSPVVERTPTELFFSSMDSSTGYNAFSFDLNSDVIDNPPAPLSNPAPLFQQTFEPFHSTLSRDWNQEYQSLLAEPISAEKYTKLDHLSRDFEYASKTYAKIIISELPLPLDQKTVKPCSLGGIAGGCKYVVGGIVFKFALDSLLRGSLQIKYVYSFYYIIFFFLLLIRNYY